MVQLSVCVCVCVCANMRARGCSRDLSTQALLFAEFTVPNETDKKFWYGTAWAIAGFDVLGVDKVGIHPPSSIKFRCAIASLYFLRLSLSIPFLSFITIPSQRPCGPRGVRDSVDSQLGRPHSRFSVLLW